MAPILTVIVCTYNRSDWLRGCLASLEPQCQDDSVEVLVVDNNSTDNTSGVVQEFCDRLPHVKYVFEHAQGLSHARNRGIKEARGNLVAYIDDDARAHSDWVKTIIRFFEATPDASGVSGPYDAFSPVPIPAWFPEEYGKWSLGKHTRKMQEGEWINGTNMVFRKQALIQAGSFNTTLGMSGTKISYGEETNLMVRMLSRGAQFYYCAEMLVYHAILPYKLRLGWLLYSNYINGYHGVTTHEYKGTAMSFLPALRKQLRESRHMFLFSKERYFKTRICRSVSPLLWHIGFFVRLTGF